MRRDVIIKHSGLRSPGLLFPVFRYYAENPAQKLYSTNYPSCEGRWPFQNCPSDHLNHTRGCYGTDCLHYPSCASGFKIHGMPFHDLLLYHPEDKLLLLDKVVADLLRFSNKFCLTAQAEWRFALSHRFIAPDQGEYTYLLEGQIRQSLSPGTPFLFIHQFRDISEFKTDDSMVLVISRVDPCLGCNKIVVRSYSAENERMLSGREVEIIQLCLRGLSSKMIADRLNISVFTVKNHKYNCMRKTGSRNIAELIHFCMKRKWISGS